MPYLTDLADALRAGGCAVWESPGWRTRGHGAMSEVRGVLIHHTAGGGVNDWRIVQNGRAGLAGPLAHMTLERDGGVRLLAAGQCWHAGTGSHPLIGTNNGNARLIGIEGVSPGVGASAWTAAQRAAYPRVAAALAHWYRIPVARVIGHKEWTPRKIDPGEWSMHDFRAAVARHLAGPVPAPAPIEEDDMAGAFQVTLPAGEGRVTNIAVPPTTGAGASAGGDTWLQITPGFEPLTLHWLRAVSPTAPHIMETAAQTLPALKPRSWKLPKGCVSVELRHTSKVDQAALVEWVRA